MLLNISSRNDFFFLVIILLISFSQTPRCQAEKGNPFRGRRQYVQYNFQKQIFQSFKTANNQEKKRIWPLLSVSTAMWLSHISSIKPKYGLEPRETFSGALKHASQFKNNTPMITAVLYNLPNRDCNAYASTGDICCSSGGSQCDLTTGGKCENGLSKYKNQYINVIAGLVRAYCGRVPMAFIIEPDALPNMVTGLGNPRCGSSATKAAYREGITYAVKRLSNACKKSPTYIHAAGGNWLGWRQNAIGFAKLIKSMNITKYIRGFATNVSGYQIVGKTCPSINGICSSVDHPCCRLDPCGLSKEWNEGFNEANYVRLLKEVFYSTIPEFKPRFVIDTGRAGESNSRRNDCGNWCNVRHARIGPRPTSWTGIASVDAFLWIKGPTESDGCTRVLPNGELCSRFDSKCESVDSLGGRPSDPRAPEAGSFFNAHFKKLLDIGN